MINLPPPQPSLYTDMFDFSPVPVEDKVAKKIAEMRKMPKRGYANLWEWTAANRPFLVPGRPFRMDNHLYLKEIYECTDLEIILMKASQMGASEWLVSYAAYICDEKDGTVLYLFPTEGHVSDFSTARLGPAIEASEYLSKIVIDGSGQGGQRGSDRISLKRIRDRFLYFRGSKVQADGKAPQLKSIDADVLIMDEVDELDPRAPAIAKKRLGHAKDDLGNVLWVWESMPNFLSPISASGSLSAMPAVNDKALKLIKSSMSGMTSEDLLNGMEDSIIVLGSPAEIVGLNLID
jgi:hypothetical protein